MEGHFIRLTVSGPGDGADLGCSWASSRVEVELHPRGCSSLHSEADLIRVAVWHRAGGPAETPEAISASLCLNSWRVVQRWFTNNTSGVGPEEAGCL